MRAAAHHASGKIQFSIAPISEKPDFRRGHERMVQRIGIRSCRTSSEPLGHTKTRRGRRAHARSFTKLTADITYVAAPICRQDATLHVGMKTAVRPVGNARNEAVLYRIEMDVVDVPFEILVVANGMLPVAALPNPLFALGNFAR